jgi:hypothetical protein
VLDAGADGEASPLLASQSEGTRLVAMPQPRPGTGSPRDESLQAVLIGHLRLLSIGLEEAGSSPAFTGGLALQGAASRIRAAPMQGYHLLMGLYKEGKKERPRPAVLREPPSGGEAQTSTAEKATVGS